VCIEITEPFHQLTNTLDFTSYICAIYVGSREKADERKISHSHYILHSHAEGTGFGTCQPEGLPDASKLGIRAEYRQQQ
jgi:hypothetical protein